MFIVTERLTRGLISAADAAQHVEAAFLALERDEALGFPVTGGRLPAFAGGFSVKSAYLQVADRNELGIKIGTYWENNRASGLPNHGSTVLLIDGATGVPRALVGASYLNGLRTAAADGLAVKYLAKRDAHVLGIVGAGHQARFELEAIALQRPIDTVKVWSRSPQRALAFVTEARAKGYASIVAGTPRDAADGVDILVTVTPSREPLVRREFVAEGTHVSSMGSDGVGKQELDVELVSCGTLVCDSVEQSISIGEFQHAWNARRITRSSLQTLGGLISGHSPGRQHDREVTIFDSSGMAIQDVAIASLALERALQSKSATEVGW